MKYDFVKNLDEFTAGAKKSFFELCLWMQDQFDDIVELIEGDSVDSDENESTDIGEVIPSQKIPEFLSAQNLFNPSEFGEGGILSMKPEDVLTNHYNDCKTFASEHNISMEDAIVGFSQKQLTFLPNACIKLMRLLTTMDMSVTM